MTSAACRPARGWIALSAFLLLALSPAAQAARQPVDCFVEVGFGDTIRRQGGVFPVAVTIDNKVGATTGIIEISQPDAPGAGEVRYVLPFASPAPSVKRFVVLVRIEAGQNLELNVRFKEHIRPVYMRLNPKRVEKPIVVCLGQPRGFGFGEASSKYAFVPAAPSCLPVDPVGLDGAHAVMFFGSTLGSLDKEQVQALRQWAVAGGRVILQDPALDPTSARNLKILAGDSGFSASSRGVSRLGAGLAASSGPDTQPNLAFWDGHKPTAVAIFPDLGEVAEDETSHFYSQIFTSLWTARRSFGAIGALWFLLVIAAYIVIIGPLDRFIIRRTKRPYLTWILFPVAIVIFSFVAYAYSNLVTVDIMRVVSANILDTGIDADAARGQSAVWVYSPKNATYEIQSPVENVFFSSRDTPGGSGPGTGLRVDIANGRASAISARIPVFSSRDFEAAWYAPWAAKPSVRRADGKLRVTPPEGLAVRAAYLADKEGLTELDKDGADWVANKATVDWDTSTRTLCEAVEQGRHQGRYFRGDSEPDRLMPPDATLQKYMLLMSFPFRRMEGRDGKFQEAHYQGRYLLRERDYRETTLDIRDRLHRGRVLLLFLAPANNLFPVNIRWYLPTTATVNLLRIQLPEEGS